MDTDRNLEQEYETKKEEMKRIQEEMAAVQQKLHQAEAKRIEEERKAQRMIQFNENVRLWEPVAKKMVAALHEAGLVEAFYENATYDDRFQATGFPTFTITKREGIKVFLAMETSYSGSHVFSNGDSRVRFVIRTGGPDRIQKRFPRRNDLEFNYENIAKAAAECYDRMVKARSAEEVRMKIRFHNTAIAIRLYEKYGSKHTNAFTKETYYRTPGVQVEPSLSVYDQVCLFIDDMNGLTEEQADRVLAVITTVRKEMETKK